MKAVYNLLLRRDPTPAEFLYWDPLLASGLQREIFAGVLVGTEEYRFIQLVDYCQHYLSRMPNPTDPFDALVTASEQWPFEYLIGLLLASDEYLALQMQHDFRHGDPKIPHVRYVKGLFFDVLARIPTWNDPGLAYWVNDLDAGRHRYLVALAFLYSWEAHESYVRSLYQFVLQRPLDEGFPFWVNQLQHGMRCEHVLAFFAGSQVFYDRVAAGTP